MQCGFNVALHILSSVLAHTLGLSRFLQTENLDLKVAVMHTKNVIRSLKLKRENAEEEFSEIFQKVEGASEKLNFPIKMPRVCGRMTQRSNIAADSPEVYYRRNFFIPFLDEVINELEKKFASNDEILIKFGILTNGEAISEVDVETLYRFYENDL